MSALTERVDAIFAQWDKNDSPGCVLAVIKDGDIIYQRGYGMADLERGTRITPDFVFDIGSTGKQFTATVTAILANQGRLSLDDSIRKHLPEMPAYADDITIQHLIHHTSGLRDYLTLMDIRGMDDVNLYPEDFIYDLIKHQKGLNFKPGKEYLYCNTGYFLLGRIAERVTDKHITKLIKELILDPLGMRHTTFNKDHRPVVKNRALSYDKGEDGSFINSVALSGGYGDGAIITNIQDLLLWDCNFYDNKLNNTQPDLIGQLHVTGRLNNGKSINYAFGLTIDTYKGQKVVLHAGGWAGYRTEMMRLPDQKFTVICISNLGSIDPTMFCQQVTDIYLAHQIKLRSTKKVKIIVDNLEQFTGIYQGKHLTVEIFLKHNILHLATCGQEHQINWLGRKKFQVKETAGTLSFSGTNNEQLTYNEYGEQATRFRRVRKERFVPSNLYVYEGQYTNTELDTRHTFSVNDGTLHLKRTPYDKPHPARFLSGEILQCDLGEMRFRIKDGTAKGYTLNADRVVNIKFRKVK